jgi:hypothetical protein
MKNIEASAGRSDVMKCPVATLMLVLIAGPSLAQSHQPYAGLQSRSIKALSEQQIADLRAGRGMSMALPAELNGYPGPLHVMEHAHALALTTDQTARVRRLYQDMIDAAVPLGERLVSQETELDRQFVERTVTPATLVATTSAIGQTQAELRATHLRFHLLVAELLTSDQLTRYKILRGYGNEGQGHRPDVHPHRQ